MILTMSPPPRSVSLPPRLVALVVDDDTASLMMVADALEAIGLTVMTARDGATALRFAENLAPDVVLLDAIMPGLDGFETCRRLKAPPLSLGAPVIFMTGLAATENVLDGLRAGGVDYVTKPLNLEVLTARITVHLLNALHLASARQALETEGRAVIALRRGRIAWASPRARDLVAQSAPIWQDDRPHGDLALWTASLPTTPLSEAQSFVHGELEIRHVGLSATSEVLLSLRRRSTRQGDAVLRERFALTDREAQVLFWLTQGKTNADIGEILGLSARTVNKHLEQVFQKLGVDNRTSAAVMADRVLHAG